MSPDRVPVEPPMLPLERKTVDSGNQVLGKRKSAVMIAVFLEELSKNVLVGSVRLLFIAVARKLDPQLRLLIIPQWRCVQPKPHMRYRL